MHPIYFPSIPLFFYITYINFPSKVLPTVVLLHRKACLRTRWLN